MNNYYMLFSDPSMYYYNVGMWGGEPTATQFSLAPTNVVVGSENHINYLFAEVPGFSKFGYYVGTGGEGKMQWCGFRPRILLIRAIVISDHWWIADTARQPFNDNVALLHPALTNTEYTGRASGEITDIYSNGWRPRGGHPGQNQSGVQYLYCAWAETPFKTARAR